MKLRLLILLLISTRLVAQNDFIITNAEQKIDLVDGTVGINYIDKILEYKSLEKNKNKIIDFNDFSYCYFENYVFMTFDLYKNNNIKGYFVLADMSKRKLLSATLPPDNDGYNKFKDQIIKYEFFIINEDAALLEHFIFDNIKIETNTIARSSIGNKIKNQFKDFPDLLARLATFGSNTDDKFNLKILEFFEFPIYMKKETAK